MITYKYDFNDEEEFHEMHHVEDPLEDTLTSILATHKDKEMVNFSHIDDPSYIYGISLFNNGLIGILVSLSNKISSLLTISMSFIS
jgi:hypothetical protein